MQLKNASKKKKNALALRQNFNLDLEVWIRIKLNKQSLRVFFGSFPGGSGGKGSAYNAADSGLIPGLGRSPGKGNGNPLQCSCLENPTNRGAWRATVHRVAKSWTPLKQLSMHACKVLVLIKCKGNLADTVGWIIQHLFSTPVSLACIWNRAWKTKYMVSLP